MTRNVVVVEDSLTQRDALLRLISDTPGLALAAVHRTESAANEWLDANRGVWDLAIIDLILEQGTGMRLIAQARDRPDTARVVVLSGYATPGIRHHCHKLGADAVFDKSSEYDAFVAYCEKLAAA